MISSYTARKKNQNQTCDELRENDGEIMNTHNSPAGYWALACIFHFISAFKVGGRVASGKWCTLNGGGAAHRAGGM